MRRRQFLGPNAQHTKSARCRAGIALMSTADGMVNSSHTFRLGARSGSRVQEIKSFIAANGKLVGVMIHAESFPGWKSLGALVSHLKFVADHRQIERIAAVTISGFLKIVPRIASHFVQASIRHFDLSEKEHALAWLETGQ